MYPYHRTVGSCNWRKWTSSACLLLIWVVITKENQITILGSLTNYRRTHLQLFTRILPGGLCSASAAIYFSDQNASSMKTLHALTVHRAPYLFTLLALTCRGLSSASTANYFWNLPQMTVRLHALYISSFASTSTSFASSTYTCSLGHYPGGYWLYLSALLCLICGKQLV